MENIETDLKTADMLSDILIISFYVWSSFLRSTGKIDENHCQKIICLS